MRGEGLAKYTDGLRTAIVPIHETEKDAPRDGGGGFGE
jgi:hypothetical protein